MSLRDLKNLAPWQWESKVAQKKHAIGKKGLEDFARITRILQDDAVTSEESKGQAQQAQPAKRRRSVRETEEAVLPNKGAKSKPKAESPEADLGAPTPAVPNKKHKTETHDCLQQPTRGHASLYSGDSNVAPPAPATVSSTPATAAAMNRTFGTISASKRAGASDNAQSPQRRRAAASAAPSEPAQTPAAKAAALLAAAFSPGPVPTPTPYAALRFRIANNSQRTRQPHDLVAATPAATNTFAADAADTAPKAAGGSNSTTLPSSTTAVQQGADTLAGAPSLQLQFSSPGMLPHVMRRRSSSGAPIASAATPAAANMPAAELWPTADTVTSAAAVAVPNAAEAVQATSTRVQATSATAVTECVPNRGQSPSVAPTPAAATAKAAEVRRSSSLPAKLRHKGTRGSYQTPADSSSKQLLSGTLVPLPAATAIEPVAQQDMDTVGNMPSKLSPVKSWSLADLADAAIAEAAAEAALAQAAAETAGEATLAEVAAEAATIAHNGVDMLAASMAGGTAGHYSNAVPPEAAEKTTQDLNAAAAAITGKDAAAEAAAAAVVVTTLAAGMSETDLVQQSQTPAGIGPKPVQGGTSAMGPQLPTQNNGQPIEVTVPASSIANIALDLDHITSAGVREADRNNVVADTAAAAAVPWDSGNRAVVSLFKRPKQQVPSAATLGNSTPGTGAASQWRSSCSNAVSRGGSSAEALPEGIKSSLQVPAAAQARLLERTSAGQQPARGSVPAAAVTDAEYATTGHMDSTPNVVLDLKGVAGGQQHAAFLSVTPSVITVQAKQQKAATAPSRWQGSSVIGVQAGAKPGSGVVGIPAFWAPALGTPVGHGLLGSVPYVLMNNLQVPVIGRQVGHIAAHHRAAAAAAPEASQRSAVGPIVVTQPVSLQQVAPAVRHAAVGAACNSCQPCSSRDKCSMLNNNCTSCSSALEIQGLQLPGLLSDDDCWTVALTQPWIIQTEATRARQLLENAGAAGHTAAAGGGVTVGTRARLQPAYGVIGPHQNTLVMLAAQQQLVSKAGNVMQVQQPEKLKLAAGKRVAGHPCAVLQPSQRVNTQ